MAINQETAQLFTRVDSLASKLGLPRHFYVKLLSEGDWSFVIQLNALVEAACTESLLARLHAPELKDNFSSLDLGHHKYGKVVVLRTLGVITREQAAVLQLLYELRNKLAHNVAQVGFSFKSHLKTLSESDLATFVRRAGHGVVRFPKKISHEAFVQKNPKICLWLTVAEILACLHLEEEFAEVRLAGLAMKKLPVATK